jgi:hypothetical protein
VARLKFNIIAGECTPGGVLAPVIAPFGIELSKLSREINEQTVQFYERGTSLTLRVNLLPGKVWTISFRIPFNCWLSSLVDEDFYLSVICFYNLFLYFCYFNKYSTEQGALRVLFSTLVSFEFSSKIRIA